MAVKLGSTEFELAQRLQALYTELEDIKLETYGIHVCHMGHDMPNSDIKLIRIAANDCLDAIAKALDLIQYNE